MTSRGLTEAVNSPSAESTLSPLARFSRFAFTRQEDFPGIRRICRLWTTVTARQFAEAYDLSTQTAISSSVPVLSAKRSRFPPALCAIVSQRSASGRQPS